MPPKKTIGLKVLVRDSNCTFLQPVATSSPNVNTNESKCTELGSTVSLKHSFDILREKIIREELFMKDTLIDEFNTKCALLLMKIDPNTIYYSTTGNGVNNKEVKEVKNKRLREEEALMPPPAITRISRKDSKKPRNDFENAARSSSVRTRSSMRIMARSNKENLQTDEESRSENKFTEFLQTPASRGYFKRSRHIIATVTPGPNVDAPQTILRRPNPGETAISLSGSPLLVTSDQTSFVPQITVPLRDGRVMAVLAKDGLNPSDFPTMDPETLSKLKLLHEFLGKL